MRPHSALTIAIALVALCGLRAAAQTPPTITFAASSYFCCGYANPALTLVPVPGCTACPPVPGVSLDQHHVSLGGMETTYNPALCNKPGLIGVHLVGTQLTFDDPMHEDQVCVVDATPLTSVLEAGMWSICTSTTGAGTRRGYGYHCTDPFPAGGFVPTSAFVPPPTYPETLFTVWPTSPTALGYAIPEPSSLGVVWMPDHCNQPGSGLSVDQHFVVTYDDPVNNDKVCTADLRPFLSQLPAGTWTIQAVHVWRHDLGVMRSIGDQMRSQPTQMVATQAIVIGTAPNPTAADCAAPLGPHAAAIFITQLETTTGRPGSRSRLNFQVAGDPIREVGVLIDDVEISTVKGLDLTAMGGVWFTQPAAGTHAIKVRVLNSYGCALVRTFTVPLVVQP